MIIILEGTDGVGKSSTALALELHLKSLGYNVRQLIEPGSNIIGQVVRPIVKNGAITETSALFLFAASTTQTLHTIEQDPNNVYIVDRSILSTEIYQQSDEPYFDYLKGAVVTSLLDRTLQLNPCIVVLTASDEVLTRRLTDRNETDKYEGNALRFNKEYLELAADYELPVIDTSNNEVSDTVRAIYEQFKRHYRHHFFGLELSVNDELKDYLVASIYEANKVVQQQSGESIPELDDHLRESTLNGVNFVLENPTVTPEQQHENWCKFKVAEGWRYGHTKDFDKKEHPCLVPYHQLPEIQQRKDAVFRATIEQVMKIYGF